MTPEQIRELCIIERKERFARLEELTAQSAALTGISDTMPPAEYRDRQKVLQDQIDRINNELKTIPAPNGVINIVMGGSQKKAS